MPKRVKIALIGDNKVGKTAFIHRFKMGQFKPQFGENAKEIKKENNSSIKFTDFQSSTQERKAEKTTKDKIKQGKTNKTKDKILPNDASSFTIKTRCPAYHCGVVLSLPSGKGKLKERFIEITLFDVPFLSKFPINSLEEWELDGAVGVRSADAFILLYDVTKEASFNYVKRMRCEILQAFSPFKEGIASSSITTTLRRTRPKLLRQSSSRSDQKSENKEQRTFFSSGSRRIFSSSSSRSLKDKTSNLTQQIGIISLHSASFAHPALPLIEPGITKGRLSTSTKPPLIVVVGNKQDLCGFNFESFDYGPCSTPNNISVVNMAQFFQQQIQSVSNVARKFWRCQHFNCSVKLDWNVTAIVNEVLRSLLVSEPPKRNCFKKSLSTVKTISFRR